jgi:hypothetical protein
MSHGSTLRIARRATRSFSGSKRSGGSRNGSVSMNEAELRTVRVGRCNESVSRPSVC